MFTFFVEPYKQVDLYLHSPEMEYKKMRGDEGGIFVLHFILSWAKIDDAFGSPLSPFLSFFEKLVSK